MAMRIGKVDVGEKQESFLNVRVRLQRLPDAKFYSGWIRMFSEQEVVVDFQLDEYFEYGTKFFMSVSGVDNAAIFPGELVSQTPGILDAQNYRPH